MHVLQAARTAFGEGKGVTARSCPWLKSNTVPVCTACMQVKPYYFDFLCSVKNRWKGMTVVDVLSSVSGEVLYWASPACQEHLQASQTCSLQCRIISRCLYNPHAAESAIAQSPAHVLVSALRPAMTPGALPYLCQNTPISGLQLYGEDPCGCCRSSQPALAATTSRHLQTGAFVSKSARE